MRILFAAVMLACLSCAPASDQVATPGPGAPDSSSQLGWCPSCAPTSDQVVVPPPKVRDTTGTGALAILTQCPSEVPTCVRMTLDDTTRDQSRAGLVMDSSGYAWIRLAVRAQVGDRAPADTALVLHSKVDGMACSALGAATAAVLGFSSLGEPIILTTQGPVTIVQSTLRLGCPDCAVLLAGPAMDTVAARRTPAWDFAEVGRRMTDLGFNDSGTLFLRNESGCVELAAASRFVAAPDSACAPMAELGSFLRQPATIRLEPAERLFGGLGQRNRLLLKSGACT